MITIAELFPLFNACVKWHSVFRKISSAEVVRLEKEYTLHAVTKKYEAWTIDNDLHNSNGPAYIDFHDDGTIWYEEWFIHGKLHNENGPARIRYGKDGAVLARAWYLYDICRNIEQCV